MSQTKAQLVGGVGISTVGHLNVYGGINATGVVTATSFVGNGSGLTGVGATADVRTNTLVVSGITTVSAGSTSAPSITPSGDSNTGIFFPSADTIAFAEGGVESVRIDSSGNLGIGTSNPTQKLEVFVNRTSSTNATSIILNDNVTGAQTNGVYKAIRSLSNNGVSISEIRFVESDGTNNNTAIALATQSTAGALTERVRVDNSGRLLVGTTTSVTVDVINSKAQIEHTDYDASLTVKRNSNGDGGPLQIFVKSRGTSNGSNTVVQNGDSLGQLRFFGTDGTDPAEGASITAQVDGTPGNNDMPTRLIFSTTADGASSPTERLRIQSDGVIAIKFSGYPDIQLSKGPVNTTGTQSIAIGQAMASATSSDNCVAIGGVSCAPSLTTGDQNTFIGAYTGSVVTTGQQNVHVGYNLSSSSTSVSNEYVFGAGLTGKGGSTAFIGGAAYQGNNSSSWSTTSDRRLKKNIVTNTEGLDKIKQLRVVNFEYRLPEEIEQEDLKSQALIKKDGDEITGIQGIQLGVIAQELQQVCPDCVKEESTGVLSVIDDNIFWHLVNAVKELSNKNQDLEAENATLKSDFATLAARVSALESA